MLKCSLCGKHFNEFDEQQKAEIHTKLQYGSAYDGGYLDLHICSTCLDMLIGQCAICPVTDEEGVVVVE